MTLLLRGLNSQIYSGLKCMTDLASQDLTPLNDYHTKLEANYEKIDQIVRENAHKNTQTFVAERLVYNNIQVTIQLAEYFYEEQLY